MELYMEILKILLSNIQGLKSKLNIEELSVNLNSNEGREILELSNFYPNNFINSISTISISVVLNDLNFFYYIKLDFYSTVGMATDGIQYCTKSIYSDKAYSLQSIINAIAEYYHIVNKQFIKQHQLWETTKNQLNLF
jgi:hypothetical protein